MHEEPHARGCSGYRTKPNALGRSVRARIRAEVRALTAASAVADELFSWCIAAALATACSSVPRTASVSACAAASAAWCASRSPRSVSFSAAASALDALRPAAAAAAATPLASCSEPADCAAAAAAWVHNTHTSTKTQHQSVCGAVCLSVAFPPPRFDTRLAGRIDSGFDSAFQSNETERVFQGAQHGPPMRLRLGAHHAPSAPLTLSALAFTGKERRVVSPGGLDMDIHTRLTPHTKERVTPGGICF